MRAGFGSQASGLPRDQDQAREAAQTTQACATDETPTAPRPTTGTPPPRARRQLESQDHEGRRRRAFITERLPAPDPVRWWNYIFVAIPALCFIASFILPERPLHDLGAGFMTDEHFMRRYLLNDTNTTHHPPPATEAVFFEYTIVSQLFTPGHYHFCEHRLRHVLPQTTAAYGHRADRRVP